MTQTQGLPFGEGCVQFLGVRLQFQLGPTDTSQVPQIQARGHPAVTKVSKQVVHPASSRCHLRSAPAASGRHPGAFGVSGTPPGSPPLWYPPPIWRVGPWLVGLPLSKVCPSDPPSWSLSILPWSLLLLPVSQPLRRAGKSPPPQGARAPSWLGSGLPGGRSSAQVPGVGGWGRYRDYDHSRRNKVGRSGLLGGADVDWLEPRDMGQGQKEGPASQGPG